MKHWLLMPALALALAALVHAAPPQIEADPNKDYPITPQVGEWVIVCGNYRGPDAANLARQLVSQLRGMKQSAYLLDFGDKKRAQMKAEEDRWKQQYPDRPFKHWRIESEYGVFLGGFADMDSARKYLNETVKKLPCPKLELPGGKPAYDEAMMQVETEPGHMQIKRIPLNPLMNSFVSRNPTLAATQKKADPFLKRLNEDEDYSLLKCKEPWTLAVQEYSGGATIVNQMQPEQAAGTNFLDTLWGWKPWGSSDKPKGESQANIAAMQAHETAKFLRQLKFEAYVLHTRNSSIVTIGGFKAMDDPAMPRAAEQLNAALVSVKAKDGRSLRDVYKFFMVPFEIPRP